MWCLEQLRLSPECLLARGVGLLRGRSCESTAVASAAFANVLTPDRIPEFCIPPLLVPGPRQAAHQNSWGEDSRTDEAAGRTDWDPLSQAALSLPHLPRERTAYGFCALLESPHTRRKESLFLGDPGAAALQWPPSARSAPRPRAHTYSSRDGGDCPRASQGLPRAQSGAFVATPAASSSPHTLWDTLVPRPRGHCLLRAPDGLLSRAPRARRSRGLARAHSISSGEEDEECSVTSGLSAYDLSPFPTPTPPPVPRPECLEAESTVTLDHSGGVLRLAAEYCPGSGHLRIRLLRTEGLARGAAEPRAVRCRISFVLRPPGKTRKPRRAVVRRSCNPVFDQDFCFDGLTEDEVRCMAVRFKVENKGRWLERGRLLGQGELLLGSLLLL
ncbi:C2 calcium-dependent domain-containing protein 4A-like [Orycteropus afer afer]|uniref:C2 calcium-dependent domain-containing protein 4A-like n=1 Tax=Orycteropus afer afer TaxID=1230840 RepID=A0A8B7B8X7_ORYAF|nr:C2 calcium-dependent domain-containing protein 4A-like [Orycteropus afer afer]